MTRLWRAGAFLSFLLLALLALSLQAGAVTCFAVTPVGTGSKDGSTWGNAMAGLPATMTRGAVYYLADGNYGHGFAWNTPDSGTSTIEIRKAQSYDFGSTGSGCSTDLNSDSSWNPSTMGSSQAVWNSGGSGTIGNISMDYLIVNGNGAPNGDTIGCGGVYANPPASMTSAPPNPKGCGIKIDDSTCTATGNNGCDGGSGVIRGFGHDITWEYVEGKGQGLNASGSNNSETYFLATFGTGSLTNDSLVHNYFHNCSTTNFTVVSGGWNNGVFAYNYSWGIFDGSVNHGEAIQLQGSNGTTTPDSIHDNIFRDQQTNGDVVAVISGTQTYAFYDNVDFCSPGGNSTSCRHNDGVIGCFNSQTCSGVLVYDNTFAFPANCGWNVSGGPSTMTVEDNLFYGCGSIGMVGGSTTVDYNTYLNSNQGAVGPHDVSSTSALDPFVSTTNFTLAVENVLWDGRLSLTAPYNTDAAGNAFTTDRGAYQFSGSVATPPQPASNLVATPH